MFVVSFDLDGKRLANVYKKNSPANAWNEIRQYLKNLGYTRIGQSLYRTPKTSIKAVEVDFTRLQRSFPWFVPAVVTLHIFRGSEEPEVARRLLAQDSGKMPQEPGFLATDIPILPEEVPVAVTPA